MWLLIYSLLFLFFFFNLRVVERSENDSKSDVGFLSVITLSS